MTPAELSSQGTQYVDAIVKIAWYVIQQVTPVISATLVVLQSIKIAAHRKEIQDLKAGHAQNTKMMEGLQGQITDVAIKSAPAATAVPYMSGFSFASPAPNESTLLPQDVTQTVSQSAPQVAP